MGSLQLLCTITHLLGEPHPQYDPKAIGAPIDPQNSCHHANKAHQAKDSLRKITLWLVVSIPLKNMSSSVGMIVPFPTEWKVIIKPIKFHGSKPPTSLLCMSLRKKPRSQSDSFFLDDFLLDPWIPTGKNQHDFSSFEAFFFVRAQNKQINK